MATYTISYKTSSGRRAKLDKSLGSVAQYAFVRKGGFIFDGSPVAGGTDGKYHPGHKLSLSALVTEFAAKFMPDTLTLTDIT